METQAIREIERPASVASRLRGIWPRRRIDPLRATAEGLGVVLDKLSYSVAGAEARRYDTSGADWEDGEFTAGRRTRGFKLHGAVSVEAAVSMSEAVAEPAAEPVAEAAAESAEAPAPVTAEERAEALDILKAARNVAADAVAPPVVMPNHERAAAQEKLLELFYELSAKRAEIVSSIFSGAEAPEGLASLFTLSTPENAKAAYNGIDAMIMKFLNAGKGEEADGAGGAAPVYSGHEAAINATEQLTRFLLNEGPEKAFSRFREVNRSNILGLLM